MNTFCYCMQFITYYELFMKFKVKNYVHIEQHLSLSYPVAHPTHKASPHLHESTSFPDQAIS